jgi:ribonuclease HI
MERVTIYTDGGCNNNRPPRSGGWAALLIAHRDERHERMISGSVPRDTTSNRMEIRAVIEGLKALKRPCHVTIVTDSQITKCCAEGVWRRKKNRDLWSDYDKASSRHHVTFEWVRGHSGHPENERVDAEAQRQRRQAEALHRLPDYLRAVGH